MTKKSKEVIQNGTLTLQQMAAQKVFTWLPHSDRRTYKAVIERERKARNLLNPFVHGEGVTTRYYVSIENINRLNKAVAEGYTF